MSGSTASLPDASPSPSAPFERALDHLAAELGLLDLRLGREVIRLRASGAFNDNSMRGLYVADEQFDGLVAGGDGLTPDAADHLAAVAATIERARDQIDQRVLDSERDGHHLPLERLADLFGLDPVDRQLLIVAVAAEVELRYQAMFAYAQNDITRRRPTVDLALRLLADDLVARSPHLDRLGADAPLVANRLVVPATDPQEPDGPLPGRYLKADRRIVNLLIGSDDLGPPLGEYTHLTAPHRLPPGAPPQGTDRFRDELAVLAARGGVVCAVGAYGSGRTSLATWAARRLGYPLLVADVARALELEQPPDEVMRVLGREARIQNAVVLLTGFDAFVEDATTRPRRWHAVGAHLTGLGVPVFLACEREWFPTPPWPDVPFVAVDLDSPTYAARLETWRAGLTSSLDDGASTELAGKFVLTPGQIRDAIRSAHHAAALRGRHEQPTGADLAAAAREQSRHDLGDLTQRIATRRSWDDIVMPERQLRQLRDVVTSVRHRHRVYADWGFERAMSLGKGLMVLFSGPSGTGKTMAAEIVAHELDLELYKVDLSSVVSKYIGETEKHLDRIFRAARASNAIVFCDEADALFGKRSEVKDAHDRYANIEVAFLLQKIEEHEGIVILATNLRRNFDEAFARRMHHTVEFPMPRAAERLRIWRQVLPPEAPVAEDVDLEFLAERFELSGGNIRNIALAAAFLAADADESIGMHHVVVATAREFEKLGRLPSQAAFGSHWSLLEQGGAGA